MADDPMPITDPGQDRRVDHLERRQDRIESEFQHLVKTMETLGGQIGGLNDKLSSFLREFNQSKRTDWKAILGALTALLTLFIAGISGAAWIITALETSREQKVMAYITAQGDLQSASMTAMAEALETTARALDRADGRIIDDYRRGDDALARRVERLEALHLRASERTQP